MYRLLFCLLLGTFLYSEQESDFISEETDYFESSAYSCQTHSYGSHSDTKGSYDIAIAENEPSSLVAGKVSAISGDFYEIEEDLVIQGAEPIHIQRSCYSLGYGRELNRITDWAIVPQATALVEVYRDRLHSVTENNGYPVEYKKVSLIQEDGKTFHRYELADLGKGVCNTSQGKISSQTNLKNKYILFDDKHKMMTIYYPNGCIRQYEKTPNVDQHYHLLSEHLSNGNWMIYDYEMCSDKERKVINLKKIRSTNPLQTKTYAWAEFIYEDPKRKNKHFFINGSDGQSVEYRFFDCNGHQDGNLRSVSSTTEPDQSFEYVHRNRFDYFNHVLREDDVLQSIHLPLDRRMEVDYYLKDKEIVNGQIIAMEDAYERGRDKEESYDMIMQDPRRRRVKTLSEPVGDDSNLHVTHSFIYDLRNRKTSVYDSENKRTDYHWDSSGRIQKIEHYAIDGKLQNAEEFEWGKDQDIGNLIERRFLDSNHKPLFTKHFVYDKRGNILEEKISGNLSGKGSNEVYTKFFKYSSTLPNQLIEEKVDFGLRKVYSYYNNTSLPLSELTYDGDRLKARKLWEYDEDLICVKEMIDDGSSVKNRTITTITPCRSGPYIGMPEIIEEKYDDGSRDVLLKKTILTYTLGGRVCKKDIYDANGNYRYSLTTEYDQKCRPIKQTNALGETEISTYDECNNKIISQVGRCTAHFTYDCSNRLVKLKNVGDDGISVESRFSYDKNNRKVREEKPFGEYASYAFDACGNLASKTLPPLRGTSNSVQFTYAYDDASRLTTETDPEGNITRTEYNSNGKPTKIVHPDGSSEEFIYNLNGTLKTYIDAEGIETSYTYDFLNRQTSKTIWFKGTILSQEFYEYNSFHLINKIDPEGNPTHYSYDSAGRLISEQIAEEKTEYAYDELGRQTLMKKGDLLSLKKYDLLGRVIEEREEDEKDQSLHYIQFTYDKDGNQKTITRNIQGKDATTLFEYDSLKRLITETNPYGNTTKISYQELKSDPFYFKETTTDPLGLQVIKTYDAHQKLALLEIKNNQGIILNREEYFYDYRGNLLKQISQIYHPNRTISTCWNYDKMGRVQTLIEEEGKTTHYSYDRKGRLTKTIKPNGVSLSYDYDPLGSLSSLSSSDGTVHYTYENDRLGRMLSSTNHLTNESTLRTYDSHGHLVEERLANSSTLSFSYDPRTGRRVKIQLPDRSSINYDYDALYLRNITRKSPTGSTIYSHSFKTYDLNGLPLEESLIGSLGTLKRRYNPCGQLDALSSRYLVHEVLKRDSIGNILKADLNETTFTYNYDDLYQLTQETGIFDHKYVSDAHNCLLQKDNQSYEVNNLLQIPSHFSYDKNGNPTNQGNVSYSYDALDRLTKVETPNKHITYSYDSDHRRISKTVHTLQHGIWIETDQKLFLYDGQNDIGATNTKGQIQELRVLGSGSQAEIGAAVAIELHGEVYAPMHDLMGNVISLVSIDSQEPEVEYTYSAFGEEENTGTLANPWRFSSKRTDEETGLVYYGRRYYSPQFGRWLTPDPAGFTDGMNLYAFVKNNPINCIDQYGLFWEDPLQGFYDWKKDFNAWDKEVSGKIVERLTDCAIGIAKWSSCRFYEMGLYEANVELYDSFEHYSNRFNFNKILSSSIEDTRSNIYNYFYSSAVLATDFALESVLIYSGLEVVRGLGLIGRGVELCSKAGRTIEPLSWPASNSIAANVNAGEALTSKLGQLEMMQQRAAKVRILPDGRIRYYKAERMAIDSGPTRGSAYVTEYNPTTGRVKGWNECYDQSGHVNRVHPKDLNGKELTSPHFPLIGKEKIR